MKDILRIVVAEPVMQGVLKLVWNDGYEGIVDLRGIIARGQIFEPIRDPDNFGQVRVERYGHNIYWGDDEFTQIDFGCDRLRELAEEQAAMKLGSAKGAWTMAEKPNFRFLGEIGAQSNQIDIVQLEIHA